MIDGLDSFAKEGFVPVLLVLGGLFIVMGLVKILISFKENDPSVPGMLLMVAFGFGVIATIVPPLNAMMTGPVRAWLGMNIEAPTGELWGALRNVGLLFCAHGVVAVGLATVAVGLYWLIVWSASVLTRVVRGLWERYFGSEDEEEEEAPVLVAVPSPSSSSLFTSIGRAS